MDYFLLLYFINSRLNVLPYGFNVVYMSEITATTCFSLRSNFLICFPMNYIDFTVKINGENNNEITILIFTVCKKWSFYEFSAKSLAQKV